MSYNISLYLKTVLFVVRGHVSKILFLIFFVVNCAALKLFSLSDQKKKKKGKSFLYAYIIFLFFFLFFKIFLFFKVGQ